MLSFRVPDEDAAEVQRWAQELGVEPFELLRVAVRRHLLTLRSRRDAELWLARPATDGERALEQVADWGPAEDWSDPLTRTERGQVSELRPTPTQDGVPTDCVANFDNVHTLPRDVLRRRVTGLSPARMAAVCRTLNDAVGC